MKNLRKLLKGLGLGAAVLAAALTGGTPASAQDTIELGVTHFTAETSLMYTLTMVPFIERLTEITDGKVTIRPYAGGVIAPPLETYQAVEDGLVDAGILTPLWVVNRDPANTFFAGHPGGMPAEMFMHWLYEGGGEDLLAEHRRETMGMHSMMVCVGPAEIWHSHKEIRVAEDLRGVRFRTAGAWATILNEYFGGAATTVPPSEVYTMLERGGVDVAEWSTPSENVLMGLQNAAPYIIMPGVHAPALSVEFMIPAATWDGLDESVRTKIHLAARLTATGCLMSWTIKDLAAMEQIRTGRAEVIMVDQSLIDDVREAGREWAGKVAAEREAQGDTWMRRVMDSYYSFYDGWLENGAYRPVD